MKSIKIARNKRTESENFDKKNIQIFQAKKKPKKHQYGHEQYRNLPEDRKQRLVEARKNYSTILEKKSV